MSKRTSNLITLILTALVVAGCATTQAPMPKQKEEAESIPSGEAWLFGGCRTTKESIDGECQEASTSSSTKVPTETNLDRAMNQLDEEGEALNRVINQIADEEIKLRFEELRKRILKLETQIEQANTRAEIDSIIAKIDALRQEIDQLGRETNSQWRAAIASIRLDSMVLVLITRRMELPPD